MMTWLIRWHNKNFVKLNAILPLLYIVKIYVGIKGPRIYVGLWALFEDA